MPTVERTSLKQDILLKGSVLEAIKNSFYRNRLSIFNKLYEFAQFY